ncbi:hypothetical protein COLO4_25231 [Corchorus olitorius]|uniref:Uncharacterized protein n=1 Tax=Corchorus olitorius TaxID=93759 RepID=A0A1R3I3Z8_9ROSI|nr:hypothetical protein COLO4_25231 [Corchorus olitorius]
MLSRAFSVIVTSKSKMVKKPDRPASRQWEVVRHRKFPKKQNKRTIRRRLQRKKARAKRIEEIKEVLDRDLMEYAGTGQTQAGVLRVLLGPYRHGRSARRSDSEGGRLLSLGGNHSVWAVHSHFKLLRTHLTCGLSQDRKEEEQPVEIIELPSGERSREVEYMVFDKPEEKMSSHLKPLYIQEHIDGVKVKQGDDRQWGSGHLQLTVNRVNSGKEHFWRDTTARDPTARTGSRGIESLHPLLSTALTARTFESSTTGTPSSSTSYSNVRSRQSTIGVVFSDELGRYHQVMVREEGEVLLNAVAIVSPQLLLLSGIGPRPYLSSLGILVAYHHPFVVQFLYDNPRNGISFVQPVPLELSLIQVVGITPGGAYIEAASNVIPFSSLAPAIPGLPLTDPSVFNFTTPSLGATSIISLAISQHFKIFFQLQLQGLWTLAGHSERHMALRAERETAGGGVIRAGQLPSLSVMLELELCDQERGMIMIEQIEGFPGFLCKTYLPPKICRNTLCILALPEMMKEPRNLSFFDGNNLFPPVPQPVVIPQLAEPLISPDTRGALLSNRNLTLTSQGYQLHIARKKLSISNDLRSFDDYFLPNPVNWGKTLYFRTEVPRSSDLEDEWLAELRTVREIGSRILPHRVLVVVYSPQVADSFIMQVSSKGSGNGWSLNSFSLNPGESSSVRLLAQVVGASYLIPRFGG